MDAKLRQTLRQLPPLSRPDGRTTSCKVCGGKAFPFDVVDFNKSCSFEHPYMFGFAEIAVPYLRCRRCGFLFTTFFDAWSEADFTEFVYNADYVKVDGDYVERRPRADAERVAALLGDARALAVLDYGGGTGILARTLRETGFDAESYDPFSSPARPDRRFDVITCFEVIEHSTDPVASLREMAALLADGGIILIGTGIQPFDITTIRANWWYVAPRNGHVSIHTLQSLRLLAATAKLSLRQNAGVWALVPSEPSAASRTILETFGPLLMTLDLLAPEPGRPALPANADIACWHGVETAERPFRWLRVDAVTWTWTPPPIGEAQVDIRLHLVNEIEAGFAARCHIEIAGEQYPLRREGALLTATIALVLGEEPLAILLHTPPPLRPSDLRGAGDTRPLGLALATRA